MTKIPPPPPIHRITEVGLVGFKELFICKGIVEMKEAGERGRGKEGMEGRKEMKRGRKCRGGEGEGKGGERGEGGEGEGEGREGKEEKRVRGSVIHLSYNKEVDNVRGKDSDSK